MYVLLVQEKWCSSVAKMERLSAEVKDLSREVCLPLSAEDFKQGAQLLVEHKGKFYLVEFISFKGII